MTIKELLLQEIDNTPNELLEDVLSFLQSLKTTQKQPLSTYQELLERIDYLETIVGICKGLDEFKQGEGIPADQAFATLKNKFNIPPRS